MRLTRSQTEYFWSHLPRLSCWCLHSVTRIQLRDLSRRPWLKVRNAFFKSGFSVVLLSILEDFTTEIHASRKKTDHRNAHNIPIIIILCFIKWTLLYFQLQLKCHRGHCYGRCIQKGGCAEVDTDNGSDLFKHNHDTDLLTVHTPLSGHRSDREY